MPVKLGVGALCRKEANILTADAAITFMMKTVGNQNSEMATKLHTASKLRISQRRKNLSRVLQYLQSET